MKTKQYPVDQCYQDALCTYYTWLGLHPDDLEGAQRESDCFLSNEEEKMEFSEVLENFKRIMSSDCLDEGMDYLCSGILLSPIHIDFNKTVLGKILRNHLIETYEKQSGKKIDNSL